MLNLTNLYFENPTQRIIFHINVLNWIKVDISLKHSAVFLLSPSGGRR